MPEPSGVSEQVMGTAVEAAMRAAYDAFPQWTGKRGAPDHRPKTYEECYGVSPLKKTDDAEEMRVALNAALPVLLASGELVSGDKHRAVLANAVEDATAGIDAAQRAGERAVRAERALADCKEALELVVADRFALERSRRAARKCLARLGSEASE